jgi:dihydrofolate synthase/folylpolyglutamate synthase
MNFAVANEYLLSLGHETLAMKLGLRSTELLLESLGNPQKSYECVQIAGTNGKGSTAATVFSICRAAGIPSGLYTSPHLVSIRERIKIDDCQISEEAFSRFATQVRNAAESLMERGKLEALPTFFEQVTAIALLAFRDANIKVAILETGMGGRLDATTVAGANIVAITPIALDHQEYLGETLKEIAFEKAAIIGPGVIAIVAAQLPDALEVILKRCSECGVEPMIGGCRASETASDPSGFFVVTFETSEDRYENVRLSLRGRHQIENAGLAIQVAEALRRRGFDISKAAMIAGIQKTEHAGRLSAVNMNGAASVLLDGAHNPSAARKLCEYFDEFVKGPLTLIFGAMRDKRVAEMAATLFPRADYLVLTRPDNPRAADIESLQTLAEGLVPDKKIVTAANVSEALKRAYQVTPVEGLICATGSLYLIGEVSALLANSSQTDL